MSQCCATGKAAEKLWELWRGWRGRKQVKKKKKVKCNRKRGRRGVESLTEIEALLCPVAADEPPNLEWNTGAELQVES